jgi:protein-disulfide isomerase
MVFIDLILHGEPAVLTAEAAHCAQDQGQFWAYHDLLFENFKGPFPRKQLDGFAKKLNLDMTAFGQCLNSHKYRAFVLSSNQDARKMGVKIIPTLLINQRMVEGFIPFKTLQPIIAEELKKVP